MVEGWTWCGKCEIHHFWAGIMEFQSLLLIDISLYLSIYSLWMVGEGNGFFFLSGPWSESPNF
ncbi:hypothetical protein Hanom_Chr07g00626441 [Helianthus anomalus]